MKELNSLGQGKKDPQARKKAKEPELALRKKQKFDRRPLFSFLLALALYCFTVVICNKYPTGEYSFILSDLKAQYAPFLALNRARILSLGGGSEHLISNLTYSFQLGLGKNFMGTFGYYMASPLNLIYLLFKPSQVDLVVILLVIIKLSISSGFMTLFLTTRTENSKSNWPVLLGIVYAFSLYAQAFAFQIMWLDGYMLLPLLLFFVEKFISRKRYLGIIVTLLVLFVSNYYIAYMVGIFSFFYLIVRMTELKTKIREAVGIAVRYVLTAGFTAMCTAVLILPVGIAESIPVNIIGSASLRDRLDDLKDRLKGLNQMPDGDFTSSLDSLFNRSFKNVAIGSFRLDSPTDIPFDGNMDSWMALVMQRGVSNLSNADWHRFFGLLTQQMMDKGNKESKEDLIVSAGLILDLCKNAPLDDDERKVAANRLLQVSEYFDDDKNQYVFDMIELARKNVEKKK